MSNRTVSASATRLTVGAAAVHLAMTTLLAAASGAALAQTASKETTLQEIQVLGTADKRYLAKSSTSATKTDTLLRDTPQSVTVITKEMISDLGMQSMTDVVRYVPGLIASQGEGNRDAVVFRGNNSTGDFYIDGIRDDVQYFRDLYNIDAVEALKGSNAMIFGRGGSGGVINRVSKQPQWNTIREGSLTLGSHSNRRATLDMGQAVDSNVAFRINAMVEDSDSYRKGVNVQRAGVNPTLAFRLGANTSAVIGYEHFRDDRVADRGITVGLNGLPYDTDESTFFGNAALSPTWARVDALSAVVEHEFGNGLSLRNRTRFADYNKFYQNFYPSSAVKLNGKVDIAAYQDSTDRQTFFNQTDLSYSLSIGGMKHKLLGGFEIGRQATTNGRNLGTLEGKSTQEVLASAPLYTGAYAFNPSTRNYSVAKAAAFYLQDQVELTRQLQAVVGLRWDRFDVDYTNRVSGQKISVTDTPVSPRLGLVFKPFDAISIYANYSKAYVPRAGDQLVSLTGTSRTFEPEEFTNKEVGVKWDITPDLYATAAIYKLDRTNVVLPTSVPGQNNTLADGQTSEGVELSLSGRITPQWSMMGGYAYTDARLSPALGSKLLAQVPEHAFSLWNRYDFNAQWGAGLGMIYRDEMYATTTNSSVLPTYTRFDAAVFYNLGAKYKLQANLENVFNKRYYASAHNEFNISPGAMRSLRVTLNAKF
ncbi:MAG: TonB-dependent siderophore receptor [Pseudomonadota bacterium]